MVDPIERAACTILYHNPPTRHELSVWIGRVVSDPGYTDHLDAAASDRVMRGAPYPEDETTFHHPGEEKACRFADRALYQLARGVVYHRLGGPSNMSPDAFDALSSVRLGTELHPDFRVAGLARGIALCLDLLQNASAIQIEAMADALEDARE